ncbi:MULTISPECIES: hypothetical protein [unclassified Janthinobacterium]|uniref:hypothetical protein n=1 Tax=unclassified Janthinobacterium TaxID=2610881 RepID=UPI000884B206|nr:MULTISPECIES: hypothetical protein [unclassified Janthinobacterium]SDA73918.1 hypothetical protein SAMN03159349_03855 [Janthinobacterium sp. 551a]SFB59358.1 hypothetical protein SAMN03159300_108262 [Janthinobacterium sp. 344]
MNESLLDIEVLALRCRSEQSRTYISEAILCYRAGAYRATIVSVWIAVIFDLVDKIRELSLAGEAKAIPIWTRYEKYIQQINDGNTQGIQAALEFERELIHICKNDLQFFDQQQMVDLQRLREDRHRCAHPSFQQIGEPYRPSAEQARLHLTNAVSHVLAQPPVQGKAQLARLLALISSNYFPQDHAQAVTQLRASALERASDALVTGFVDMAIFQYFDDKSPLYWKPQARYALNAVIEIHRPQAEARVGKQLNRVLKDATDSELASAAALVTGIHSYWGMLLQPGRDKLKQFIQNSPNAVVLPGLPTLLMTPELAPLVVEKVETFNIDDLSAAINSFGLKGTAKERTLQLISKVRSYDSANDALNRLLLPIFNEFTKNDFIRLIRLPTTHGADLIGANAYTVVLKRIQQTSLFDTEEFNILLEENNSTWIIRQ